MLNNAVDFIIIKRVKREGLHNQTNNTDSTVLKNFFDISFLTFTIRSYIFHTLNIFVLYFLSEILLNFINN